MADLTASFCIEGREILHALTSELLALEKSPGNAKALATCLRLMHTLKGSARIVRQFAVGDMAHTLEDALLPLHGSSEEAESEYFTDLLRIVARMQEAIEKLESEISAKHVSHDKGKNLRPSENGDGEVLETVRVNIADMDQLLEGLSEASIQLGPLHNVEDTLRQAVQMISSLQETLRSSHAGNQAVAWARLRTTVDTMASAFIHAEQTMTPSLSRLEREIEEVRAQASTLRLLPVSTIVNTLELATRDAASVLHKSVTLLVNGADTTLEGHILLSVRDALLHVIRNAVDHGLESAAERAAANKPAIGTIRLDIVRHGRRVEFRCRDDGRGINPEKVRAEIVNRGRLTKEQAATLSTEDLFSFLFETGLSTADRVTEISGRGVGLDVVRVVANRLRGQATIHSELGRGTEITIDIPMSLSAMTVLSVAVGDRTVLIPFDAVRRTLRVPADEVIRNSEGESVLYEQRAIPFIAIRTLLGIPRAANELRKTWTIIIVQAGSKWSALGADSLVDTIDIVVKPLPPGVDAAPFIAGAAFDSNGDPLLVLDPMGIDVVRADVPLIQSGAAPVRAPRLPILVIDDSLTTRMLEQSILEAAGYTVDLCASAEDALRRAQSRTYGLFIVDVEMPGMNGYEFTRTTRADPTLSSIPVIMVTSLSTSEDRQRGLDMGASDYIVKGDFDQKHFVRKVAELLGDA